MLAELGSKDTDEVYKASFVRLLRGCPDPSKWPFLLTAAHDPSPLVRSSAVSALGDHLTPEAINELLAATGDRSRLVRIRAAMSLAALPPESLKDKAARAKLEKANRDFILAMQARPDDWASHANLGNYYMEGHDFAAAASCFETATQLEPRVIGPLVNASMAYSNLGQNDKAQRSLRRRVEIDPDSAAANFNLGLLLGEQGHFEDAERALRTALKTDPQMAAAAYNLGVILAKRNLDEAIVLCQKAHDLRPDEPKYAYTLAIYQRQKGNTGAAIELLKETLQREPHYLAACLLLGEIYEERREFSAAAAIYRDALKLEQLPDDLRRNFEDKLHSMPRTTDK